MFTNVRPSPAIINSKFRALVREGMQEPGTIFQFIDYALFDERGVLVDVFHHIKCTNDSFSDGWQSATDEEAGYIGLPPTSSSLFAMLDMGYQNDPFGVADYLAACARTYPEDRAEWNDAWMSIMSKLTA